MLRSARDHAPTFLAVVALGLPLTCAFRAQAEPYSSAWRWVASTDRPECVMIKTVIGVVLLVAIATPGLAQSSSTTTTTTGPADPTETYYVVQDPTTKRCTVTTEK